MSTFAANVHKDFQFNGYAYTRKTLQELAYELVKEGNDFEIPIGQFISDWLDQSATITVQTSGSTGKPKTISLKKQYMVESALTTGRFFHLEPKSQALLCLPATTIAGKMMLVRAMVLGWHLDSIPPKKDLEINAKKAYTFAAMIPLQLQANRHKLNNIETLIVGGAPMSAELKSSIQTLKTKVFETYGMTETVSHIAVKQSNHVEAKKNENLFQVLPGITISQDSRGCLVIDAEKITNQKIITNDVVTCYSPTTFEWLGRADYAINSGGVKIHPEVVERILAPSISNRFFITSVPDKSLGERVIMVVEGDKQLIDARIFSELKKHEIPKDILFTKAFQETHSGKVQRKQTLEAAKKNAV
ncbi:AMP-binding protein [Bizionia sediminis]|uniref:AMP-binding protein n=1 Tax=Bizionia sediminis TaxID=1737064 RepID=A0ABW5KQ67_9FLAO